MSVETKLSIKKRTFMDVLSNVPPFFVIRRLVPRPTVTYWKEISVNGRNRKPFVCEMFLVKYRRFFLVRISNTWTGVERQQVRICWKQSSHLHTRLMDKQFIPFFPPSALHSRLFMAVANSGQFPGRTFCIHLLKTAHFITNIF